MERRKRSVRKQSMSESARGRKPLGTGESGHECLSQKDNNVLIGIMKWLLTKHVNVVNTASFHIQ